MFLKILLTMLSGHCYVAHLSGLLGVRMNQLIRWVLLIAVFGSLYFMGRDVFHLKHTKEFFLIVYLLCLFLGIGFVLTAKNKEDA